MQAMYTNGDIYVGMHKNGIKKGRGTYYYTKEGIKYVGDWEDNIKKGKGELVYERENNATFVGHFDKDSLVKGDLTDSVGNLFRSRELPNENEQNRINQFI